MKATSLITKSEPFLTWLVSWKNALPTLNLDGINPERTMLLSSDLIRGFCTEGPLASSRIQGIVPEVVKLFNVLHKRGVRHFILTQDAHDETAAEFDAYGAHCVAGTRESETIPELVVLPYSETFITFPKNSISSTLGTGLNKWLDAHPALETFFIVGDCTDICIYEAALDLRLRANVAKRREARVIVPADCVQTYDMPVEKALELGTLPHDGDLLHHIFLYQMALNGIEIVAHVA